MLWEEMEKYTKLTGEDGTHVPIMKLGAYLDGYYRQAQGRREQSMTKEEKEAVLHCLRAMIDKGV